MGDEADPLAEADKAFVASMQALDAELDASAKGWSDKILELQNKFVDQAEARLKAPLEPSNVDADSSVAPGSETAGPSSATT